MLEGARSLTDAPYGVIVILDDSLQIQNFLTSSMTPEQAERLLNTADGRCLFESIGGFSEPVRHRSFEGYVREVGLPEFDSPVKANSGMSFLCTPITHQGRPLGMVYLLRKEDGAEFMQEDEETLLMFASQAALVNAAPLCVVVLDAGTGVPVYVNREVVRIGRELRSPHLTVEDLFTVIGTRRADGRETSVQDIPLATALSVGE